MLKRRETVEAKAYNIKEIYNDANAYSLSSLKTLTCARRNEKETKTIINSYNVVTNGFCSCSERRSRRVRFDSAIAHPTVEENPR